MWLVLIFKSATSEVKASNLVTSVFHNIGLPNSTVSYQDCLFTVQFLTSLNSVLGSNLIFGLQEHHNTKSKVELVNSVIADILCAFINDRQDNWQELTPLVEFTINNIASPLGTGFTTFFADSCQHPSSQLAPPTSGTSLCGTPNGQRNCQDLRSSAGVAGHKEGSPRPQLTGRVLSTARSGAAQLQAHPSPLQGAPLIQLGWPVHCAGTNCPQHVSA